MSGRPLGASFAQGVLWTVLAQTDFGNDWLVRLVVGVPPRRGLFAPSLSAQRHHIGLALRRRR